MSSADSDGRIIMASEPAASPDDNADATASPQRPSPPNATARTAQAAQETGGGTGVGDSTAAPQYAPRDGMAVPAVSALNDGGPPVPVRQAVDHGRESDGPQLHDGPPGPPSFPLEFDDSLAKGDVVGQEEEADGPQLHHGPPGPPSFPHEFDDSLAKGVENELERSPSDHARDYASAVPVANAAAVGPSMLEGAGGTAASTIRALDDDDPPIPVLHVVDHGRETDGPQLHDGPPGPPCFLHEFDDSLAKRAENESEQSSSDHARDNEPMEHSTTGASVANAAAEGPSVVEDAEEGSVSLQGAAPPTSPLTETAVNATVFHNPPSSGRSAFIAEAYRFDGGRVYEAELAEPQAAEPQPLQAILPFYQRKGYASVMIAVTLLAVVIAVVLLSKNFDGNTGDAGDEEKNDAVLISVVPQPSPPPGGDSVTGQSALKSLVPSSAPVFNIPFGSVDQKPTPFMATDPDTSQPILSNIPTLNQAFISLPPTSIVGSVQVFRPSVSTLDSSLKLLAPDGATYDYFGRSAAIFQDTIVVCAWGDDDNGDRSGSAHVFVRSGGEWSHQAKLLAPDGARYDAFGQTVAIYGDTIVVGTQHDGDQGGDNGSAHVFVRSGEIWAHEAKLLAPDGVAGDRFGDSVAMYEEYIVVGAPWDDDNGDYSGSAHVFVRSGEEWTHQVKLLAPDGATGDYFGESVAIHGDTIVVGAPWDDDNGNYSGSSHVFVRSGEEWAHQAKLLAPDGAAGDRFGESVTTFQDTIVVGARWNDDNGGDTGSAHVFVRSGEEWSQQYKLLAPGGAAGDRFGESVTTSQDTIVVGAPGDDDNGGSSGSAHVFVKNGEEWSHQVKLLAPDGAANDRFGESVAVNENTIVVGAPWDDDNGEDSGSSHVFVVQG